MFITVNYAYFQLEKWMSLSERLMRTGCRSRRSFSRPIKEEEEEDDFLRSIYCTLSFRSTWWRFQLFRSDFVWENPDKRVSKCHSFDSSTTITEDQSIWQVIQSEHVRPTTNISHQWMNESVNRSNREREMYPCMGSHRLYPVTISKSFEIYLVL